jgi:proteasome lid subunit RPN8/RPN11
VVQIPREVLDGMIAHARRARPRECCGLLVGRGARVAEAAPMRNVARGFTRYRVSPAGHFALRRALRDRRPGRAILGVYHSHPRGRARPSETDLAEAHYPDWIHVIVGLGGARPEVRAFTIVGGRARVIPIRRR